MNIYSRENRYLMESIYPKYPRQPHVNPYCVLDEEGLDWIYSWETVLKVIWADSYCFRFGHHQGGGIPTNLLITVMPHELHGISNHWQLECFFNSLFRITSIKTSISAMLNLYLCQNHRRPVDSPKKRASIAGTISMWRDHDKISRTWRNMY